MIVRAISQRCVEMELAAGQHRGRREFLPRIPMEPSDTDLPFALTRLQFPIRPCFAMTINKSQGQTLDFVGLYLPQSLFSHGQLYVALSRVRRPDHIAVFVKYTAGRPLTRNVVFREILQWV